MTFPKELQETFTSAEIVYLAENELIEVISNVSMNDKLSLISTELPKFRVMSTYKIPIWLAIILRKQNKITVPPPEWLNENYLANKYQEEVTNQTAFTQLPNNWLEVSKIFLKHFVQDLIDNEDVLLKLIQDLKEIRLVKLRKGLNNLNEINLGFNDLSLMEINEFRPFISRVMGNLAKFQKSLENEEGVENYDDAEDPGDDNAYDDDDDDDDLDNRNTSTGGRKDSTMAEANDDIDDEDMEMEDIVNEFEL
ncbi:DNA replication protein [Saccharomycopsis crataegensis]|uniref:DNA replication complex GINS protein PSF2 n=1 Tax=Saccharomycopsis crataegensis TaxID=43959 RepID=A0AAV5QQI3_9ASCO|nr:DNA replication protein [Saccharomycopsis crataegensis]